MFTARSSRRWSFFLLTFSLLLWGSHARAEGLLGLLTDQLGVSQEQAAGGAGSLFQLAKSKLSDTDFSQVASAVPDMDSLLKAAPAVSSDAGASGGGLGGMAASMLGGGASKLAGMAGLADSFKSLGMDGGMVGKFVPVVLDYVQSSGGQQVMEMLKGVFM